MSHLGLIAPDEQVHEHNDAEGCRQMWQAVLFQAFVDATYNGTGAAAQRERRFAHDWISWCGRDFRQVCDMAGMDADFLSEAYKAGRVDRGLLKGADRKHNTENPIPHGKIGTTVLSVIEGEMTAKEIAENVRRKTGHEITPDHVADTLRTQAKNGSVSKRKMTPTHVLWSLSHEPHVSCKDRIAAAKREAGA